ncbi:MAG TPA: M28 family peptidase [Flavipsychrobacter sp.]
MNTPKAIAVVLFMIMMAVQPLAAKDKSDKKTVKQLKEDISYLASDELEGRRTGSAGEQKAVDFIIARYQKLGIKAYEKDYRHSFAFVNGKEILPATFIRVAGSTVNNRDEAFPAPFSATNKKVKGEVIPGVYEQGNIWMIPLFADKDEAEDAHFDWEKFTFERAKDAAKQGAIAVLFYDSYGAKFPPEFLPKSEYESLDIPVAILTNKGYESYIRRTDNNVVLEMNIALKKIEMTGTNVAAFIDNGAKYTVVLGAHLDHLGYGEDGNSLNAKKDRQIHNGADDNASGTAALMQLAGWIKDAKLKKYNYLFLHFSGEELGLLGSKAIVKDAALDSNKIAYMINMDMLGRLNDSTHALTVGGVGTSPVWGTVIDKKDSRFRISFDSAGVGPSDHTSFYHHGVPVLFFFTGLHTDYHKPSDDADKINYKGEAMVMNYIYNVVTKMEKLPRPAFTTTKQSTVGKVRFKVTLGIMPDYSYQEGGVKVDGVTEGKPAIAAGVKAGDIILQLGEYKINGMQSYMEALGKFAAGDKTQVTIKRDGKEMKLPIEFK